MGLGPRGRHPGISTTATHDTETGLRRPPALCCSIQFNIVVQIPTDATVVKMIVGSGAWSTVSGCGPVVAGPQVHVDVGGCDVERMSGTAVCGARIDILRVKIDHKPAASAGRAAIRIRQPLKHAKT